MPFSTKVYSQKQTKLLVKGKPITGFMAAPTADGAAADVDAGGVIGAGANDCGARDPPLPLRDEQGLQHGTPGVDAYHL
jgi:hypothetical protein